MKKHLKYSTSQNAFTLIELLTVIAIIGILAAIIIPVTGRVRSSARSAQCLSNLRQIGNAAQLWSVDNKGRIVAMRDPGADNWKSLSTWTGDLAPYAGWSKPDGNPTSFNAATDVPVFTCPQRGKDVFGYGHNWYSLSYLGGGKNRWAYYERIPAPSMTVFMTDSLESTEKWRPFVRLPANTGETDSIVDFRHPGDTANVLWVDGHVSGAKKSGGILLEPKNWGFVGDGNYNIVTGRDEG